jgi:hypothetical protein
MLRADKCGEDERDQTVEDCGVDAGRRVEGAGWPERYMTDGLAGLPELPM